MAASYQHCRQFCASFWKLMAPSSQLLYMAYIWPYMALRKAKGRFFPVLPSYVLIQLFCVHIETIERLKAIVHDADFSLDDWDHAFNKAFRTAKC